jgi:hypothetical protein
MRHAVTVVLLTALVVIASPLAAKDTSPFTFTPPTGWTEITPDTPDSSLTGVPAGFVQQIRGGQIANVGVDVDSGADGFYENYNVVLNESTGRVTESLVSNLADELVKQVTQSGAKSAKAVTHSVILVNGVHVGRVVTDIDLGTVQLRDVAFLIPGRTKSAVLTCSAAADKFDRYEPLFDDVAKSVGGAVEPSGFSLGRIGKGALIGAIVGLVIALIRKASN